MIKLIGLILLMLGFITTSFFMDNLIYNKLMISFSVIIGIVIFKFLGGTKNTS
jgi:hypothetical protein